MKCPNCQALDPTPPPSDNGTTTCPKCGHRFPLDEATAVTGVSSARTPVGANN
jgi:hypothetical protein